MASQAPLLSGTIEADEDVPVAPQGSIGKAQTTRREPELLVPGTQANGGLGSASAVEEGGIVSCIGCSDLVTDL
jgi:hypothetical protein